jgi:hypothetical protein
MPIITFDDETIAAFESDFGAAVALHGLDESHRELFREHWGMNPHMHDAPECVEQVASFARTMKMIEDNPLAPRQAPAPKGPTVPAPETPAALDKEGRALYERVEKRAQDEKVDWFTAFAKVTGAREFTPPRIVVDPASTSSDTEDEAEEQLASALMLSYAIAYLDAVQLVRHTKELAEARKGPEPTDAPWLDTRPLSTPPRPWAEEDWERDKRRAAAGNVSLDRAEWEVAAEEGEDLVPERAEKARADHLAELEGRSEYHVRTAQKTEAKMRAEAIEAELDRRAESRIEGLKSRRGRF